MKKLLVIVLLLITFSSSNGQNFTRQQIFGCWEIKRVENIDDNLKNEFMSRAIGQIICFDSLRIYGKKGESKPPVLYYLKDGNTIVSYSQEPGKEMSETETQTGVIIEILAGKFKMVANGYNFYLVRVSTDCCE